MWEPPWRRVNPYVPVCHRWAQLSFARQSQLCRWHRTDVFYKKFDEWSLMPDGKFKDVRTLLCSIPDVVFAAAD